ncbi:metal-dependent hydrolase [Leminorella grimontii]|nr:metal-dependent hydrolase [Leminorella grimontii]
MNLTQIRNATIRLEYGGKRFLIDPMLADKGAYPGFTGTLNAHLRNPLVALPMPIAQIVDVDAVIVTHTHPDHWDDAAAQALPKDKPIFTQNEGDAEIVRAAGFRHVEVLSNRTEYEGVMLVKTSGQHGSNEAYANADMVKRLGEVCGIVFKHSREKTLYVAGDTVWNQHVANALSEHAPQAVVLNAGFAQVDRFGAIIMGAEDVFRVHQASPKRHADCNAYGSYQSLRAFQNRTASICPQKRL